MAKKSALSSGKTTLTGKPSALVDTRVIYCGDNFEQLKKLPENCTGKRKYGDKSYELFISRFGL